MKRSLVLHKSEKKHQSCWPLKTITIVSENKRRPLISSESQCFLENGKESASKTHHRILFPAPALETAASHARTTRASIDLLRSILRNRIRAAVSYIIARVACVSRSRRNSFDIHHFETMGISDHFFTEKKGRRKIRSPLLLNNHTFLRGKSNRTA